MQQPSENRAQPKSGRILGRVGTALLLVTALCQSDLAHAAPHGGGGGFHGGGRFHGGWHGGVAGLHNGLWLGGHWYHAWRGGRYGLWWGDGLGWTYDPYVYGSDYYSSGQPSASQNWYYCGYHPLRNAVQYGLANGSG
jgi:hypothetical protein